MELIFSLAILGALLALIAYARRKRDDVQGTEYDAQTPKSQRK